MNSETIVESLRPYGFLHIHQFDNGWCASLDLFVKGMSAKTESGFKHPTMQSALTKLHANTMELVGNLQAYTKALPAIEQDRG